MKHRGKLIIEEFEVLRSIAGKSGLELPDDITQGKTHFRKRDQLFKKLKLDPTNEHHVAFLCSIVHDHLYLSDRSAAHVVYGDNEDFNLLRRYLKSKPPSRLRYQSDRYRHFVKLDTVAAKEHGTDKTIDRFRMRLERAAKKAVNGKMKLTVKQQDILENIRSGLRSIIGRT